MRIAANNSKASSLILAALFLGISYGFVSLAIDRGNLAWYLLALIFFTLCIKNLIKLAIRRNGKHKTS